MDVGSGGDCDCQTERSLSREHDIWDQEDLLILKAQLCAGLQSHAITISTTRLPSALMAPLFRQ